MFPELDSRPWAIEAKTGARSGAIGKRDLGQLAESLLWFGERYDPEAVSTPVMVHRAVAAYKDATPPTGMRILGREEGIGDK